MLPTVFASFTNGEVAERLVGSLLESGVAAEDMSLIVKNNHASLEDSNEALVMVDSGDAETIRFGHTGIQTEGSYVHESRIGGGISTSTPDDDVSSVEEMDDSQEAAEEMSYPASAQSYSSQERRDTVQATNTGFFNTTKPNQESLGLPNVDKNAIGDEISSVAIPNLGIAIGDGALATSVMGAGMADEVGGVPAAHIQDYLEDQGVPADLAFMLGADFEKGGAVVAIATPPGGADYDVIQQVLEDVGARNVQLIEATD
ncbi:MAG TPA: hypothetical protein VGL56_15250 [Fimbriimonadaceae bacterium]|jgi:hypothetical protein